jgi:putative restriction endonuclease
MARFFGPAPGVTVGSLFSTRRELHDARLHAPLQAGISGSGSEGADSIVVSGGYEDDEDLGDVIVYTGHGGNDPSTGRQVADQVLERGNLGLAISSDQGLPVRVIRGSGGEPTFSPTSGYRV